MLEDFGLTLYSLFILYIDRQGRRFPHITSQEVESHESPVTWIGDHQFKGYWLLGTTQPQFRLKHFG